MADEIGAWLREGEAAEADWGGHLLALAARGDLGRVGADLLLDLPALAQRHGCRSVECTPGMRQPRTRSCCADLEVSLTPSEIARIEQEMGDIAGWMDDSDDPRWMLGSPTWHQDGVLTRPRGRCVFAISGPRGLSCGLHEVEDIEALPRGTLKPLPCRLFPLVVVDMGDGRLFLTAVHARTARRLGHASAKVFPCLRGDPERPMLVMEAAETLGALLGKRRVPWIIKRVAAWAGERAAG